MTKKYILASINIYVLIITSLIYLVGLLTINLYPTYTNILITIILATITTITLICYFNKNKNIYNLGILLTILFNAITIYNIVDLNIKYDYIHNLIAKEYKYDSYNIYVARDNYYYSELEKLNNKSIGTLKDNSNNICTYLNTSIKVTCKNYNTLEELYNSLSNYEIQAIIISSEYDKEISDPDTKYKLRIINKTKIKDTNL